MKQMHHIEKKQRGFTLIEFMVVIALIGLGLVLVVTQFGQANSANKSSTAIKNITSLSGGIASLKATRGGYSGVTDTALLTTNAVPDNMITTAAAGTRSITNVFGGTVTVAQGGTTAAPNNNEYLITYPNVDKANCVEIGSRLNSSFVSIKVSTVTITDLATAATACAAAVNTMLIVGK